MPVIRRAAAFIADNEFWLVWIYGLPLLLASSLPEIVFAAALATVPFFWLARRIARQAWSIPTPLDLPILLLLVMGIVGVVVSAEISTSRRSYELLLGSVALFYGLVNGLTGRDARPAVGLLCALSVAMGMIGILGLRYSEKFLPLPLILPVLPRIDFSFFNARGFTPNIVAGAIAPVIPIFWAWAWGDASLKRRQRAILVALSLLLGIIVVLTQSRGALVGLGVGFVVLAVWRGPPVLWIVSLGALALAAYAFWMGLGNVAALVLHSDPTGNIMARFELWSHSLRMLQDFPITGIGSGRFQDIVVPLYPLFLNSPGVPLPHAHNLYLQVGIDYGLPGFVAYIGLVATALSVGTATLRRTYMTPGAWLAAGLLAGYVVFLTHGLLDAVATSTKVSLVVWFLLALMVVLSGSQKQLGDSMNFKSDPYP